MEKKEEKNAFAALVSLAEEINKLPVPPAKEPLALPGPRDGYGDVEEESGLFRAPPPKLKKYNRDDIKKVHPKPVPERNTFFQFEGSDIKIELTDFESPFEAVSGNCSRPGILKNACARISGIQSFDEITVMYRFNGDTEIYLDSEGSESCFYAGVIYRFEIEDGEELITIDKRDINEDKTLVGGPGKITFLYEEEKVEEQPKLTWQEVSQEERMNAILKQNRMARSSLNWKQQYKGFLESGGEDQSSEGL